DPWYIGIELLNGGVSFSGDGRPIAGCRFWDIFVAGANGGALLIDIRITEIGLDQGPADCFRPRDATKHRQTRSGRQSERKAARSPDTVGDDRRPLIHPEEQHRRPVFGRRCPARPTFGCFANAFEAFDCSNRLTAANATKPQIKRPANRR
ncbi:MAG TPA: hypothetical protein VII20_17465, partial [Roseiarcus sp.]